MRKIGEIDYNLKTPKKSLFLCKPNKTTIAKISEAYDIQYYTKLGTVNELSFKIPTIIIKDDVPMENPNITRIKNRYLFKLTIGKVTEYFLLNDGTKVYGEKEYIEYRAYSLGSQLSDKNIREFHHIGNLLETANALLDEIYIDNYAYDRWQIDYVDSYFLAGAFSQREYEVSSMSALESIYDMAEKWNAVIKWDTINHKISFFKAENVGLNKGFYIRDGKYLENFNLQIDTTSTITRVKAFGSDGLNLTSVNPTGQYYVEDFSFYIYPFEYDEATGTVLKSSDYMSDELCIALHNYKNTLSINASTFKNHVDKINTLRDILRAEESTLTDYQLELTLLENKRDILLAEFQKDKSAWGTNGFNDKGTKEGTPEHLQVLADIEVARNRLSAQQTMVQNAEFDLADAELDKNNYIASLSHHNHFSPSEWSELQQFIIEKEYTNDSITDVYELLEEAKIVLKQNQEPAIKLTLNIIDFLSVVECQNDWDKLGLGDTIRIKYDRLKVNINAKIIEINYDFENFTIALTIANEKDLRDGTDKLMDLLNKADITSTIVQMDRNGWNLSKENNGKINELINNKWDSLKQAVLAGYDQQISISERGIIVKSLDDPNSWLVIQNGFLAITNDAGSTWKHAISKDGIWGEYIFGKIISGVNLLIEDESGIWKTQGSRTTIYDRTGKETMWLGLVSDNARDQFDNILEEAQECFGLKSWNDHTKVEISTCAGLAISRWKNNDWQKVLWANTDGTLYSKDLVAQGIKIVNNIGDVILDAEMNEFYIGVLSNIVADGKLTTLEKLQITKELHSIHTDYKNLLEQARKYEKSNRDNITNINGAWNVATQSFPTTYSTKNRLDVNPLIEKYTTLLNYISSYIPVTKKGIPTSEILEIDHVDPLMEETSEINNRGYFVQVFRDYYDESQRLKQAIEDSIFYSGIHMGEYYNNLIMNEFGFIAVRNDGKYRAYLNATNGLALEKWENNRWVKKLYATLGDSMWEDGTLVAEGLVTKNLKIVNADMNERIIFDWYKGITILGDSAKIFLNANDAIKITDNYGDKKFWVDMNGHLFAKDITTHNLKIVDGNLGEKIILDQKTGITIRGKDADIFLNANDAMRIKTKSGEDRFWVDTNGLLFAKKLYIMGDDDEMIKDIDGSYISDLTVNSLKTLGRASNNQDIVHIKENFIDFNTVANNTEITKLKMTFVQDPYYNTTYPIMIWGTGNSNAEGSGSRKGYLYKDSQKMAMVYDSELSSNGSGMSKLLFNNGDENNHKQSIYMRSKGGIRLESENKIVMKCVGTENSDGSSQELAKEAYIKVGVSGSDRNASMKFGEATVVLNDTGITIKWNDSNYITINANGVTVKGNAINLN